MLHIFLQLFIFIQLQPNCSYTQLMISIDFFIQETFEPLTPAPSPILISNLPRPLQFLSLTTTVLSQFLRYSSNLLLSVVTVDHSVHMKYITSTQNHILKSILVVHYSVPSGKQTHLTQIHTLIPKKTFEPTL